VNFDHIASLTSRFRKVNLRGRDRVASHGETEIEIKVTSGEENKKCIDRHNDFLTALRLHPADCQICQCHHQRLEDWRNL